MRSGVLRIWAIDRDGPLTINIEDGLPIGGTKIPNGLNIDLNKSDGAGVGWRRSFEEAPTRRPKLPRLSHIR